MSSKFSNYVNKNLIYLTILKYNILFLLNRGVNSDLKNILERLNSVYRVRFVHGFSEQMTDCKNIF